MLYLYVMGRKYAIRDQNSIYFVTFTVIQWIDVFTRDNYRTIFLDSVRYCQQNKGLEVYAWCLMTNHVHMILSASNTYKLSDIIRDLKSYTSRHIRKALESDTCESRRSWMLHLMKKQGVVNPNNRDFQFWQQYNHPIELDSNHMIDSRLEYLHNNPVEAGFVEKPEDWLYSSACDYCGRSNGLLDIILID